MKRKFPLSTILAVTSEVILPGCEGIADLQEFITGSVESSQRYFALKTCRDELLKQFPQLQGIVPLMKQTPSYYLQWLAEQESKFGKELEVKSVRNLH